MTEIVLSSRFRKAFKRKVRGNKILEARFRDRMVIFQTDPFDRVLGQKFRSILGLANAIPLESSLFFNRTRRHRQMANREVGVLGNILRSQLNQSIDDSL